MAREYQHEPNNKNFGLSNEQYEHLSQQLRTGQSEELLGIILTAFYRKCTTWLQQKFKVTDSDRAHDIFMDTMELFRTKVVQDKIDYGNLEYLFTLMAKQHYIRSYAQTNLLPLPDYFQVPILPNDDWITPDLLRFLAECKDNLKKNNPKYYGIICDLYELGLRAVDIYEFYYKNEDGVAQAKKRALEMLRKCLWGKIGTDDAPTPT